MPTKPVYDLTNQKFGRWTVLRYAGKVRWLCRCECGNQKNVPGHYLRAGTSSSCGCLAKEILSKRARRHGLTNSPEWNCWCAMRQRCNNPSCHAYPDYGGRGIKVCDRWLKFENFLADMGPRPGRGFTLEREKNDGNYEPGNCRWAPRVEQEHNKRSNHFLTFKGRTYPLAVWARRYGILPGTLKDRLAYGWSTERALTTPVRPRRANHASH